jgi:thymidylate synthase ThyX
MFRYLVEITPKPSAMKQESYERTLKARAFDVSRYLLPLATNTSLGEIVNARTLEAQISRLLSHTHGEIRHLGELLKQAAAGAAYNVNHQSWQALVADIREVSPALAERAEQELLRPVRVAPTLVKYAEPNPYEIRTRRELAQMAAELLAGAPSEASPGVDLLDSDPLEIELATALLYGHCHHSYRQIRDRVSELGEKRRREILDCGFRHRGPHDELLRPFRAGQGFRFDVLMDIGGFRDMHRHRRCIQIEQPFTIEHGYEIPRELEPAGSLEQYRGAMEQAARGVRELARGRFEEADESAQYAIPLGFRKRALFNMDFAEAVYIAELRTSPAGHFSYRQVAYAMFEAVGKRHPALAEYFRVHDVREAVDLLQR